MKTNLIQSYIDGNNFALQQYNSDKVRHDFDVKKELTNHTFIKPLPGNGKLVKNSVFDTPAELFKDYKYNLRAFRHALKGKANDHELGTLNDFGMKLGGLAIATYLLTKRATPKTKIMEFVGFATFFAAMDIWPKLALQLPAQMLHGFNIRQKYRDNVGTKKMVFQDHQFIPWDLYSDEEINKIGDRMRVPKDMKNRRDFIQEKMRKIALQNNTMWMLTSGFATPIMSALLCNILEKPIAKIQHNTRNVKANELLANFPEEISKYNYDENSNALSELLAKYKDKPVNSQMLKRISANLSEGVDDGTAKAIFYDLKNLFGSTNVYTVDKNTVQDLTNLFKKNFLKLGLSKGELDVLVPSEKMAEIFEKNGLLKDGISDFSQHLLTIQKTIMGNASKLYNSNNDKTNLKRIEFILDNMLSPSSPNADSEVKKILKSKNSAILNSELSDKIINISKVLNGLKARSQVLDKYVYLKAAQAPETVLANVWNNFTDELPEIFGITPDEIKKSRYDRELVSKLLQSKIESIVSNDEHYENVVKMLAGKLVNMHLDTDFGDSEKLMNEDISQYKMHVVQSFDSAGDSLKELNMPTVARRIVGYDKMGDKSSLKNIQLSYLTDRVKGVRTSFYQLLNTLDVYRRIAKSKDANSDEAKLAKSVLLEGHTSDYATKFYMLRHPKNSDNLNELVEFSNDSEFYKRVMNLMFNDKIDETTKNKTQDSVVLKALEKYRKDMYEIFGDEFNFAKPYHIIRPNGRKATSEEKFIQKGCPIDEMFFNLFKSKYNSQKWFNIFGKMGAILFGVTVLSQFFMGRMKTNKENKS